MRPLLLAVTLGMGLSVLAPSAEQSLAEVSRNTEAARNATPGTPPARVYSNKDLPEVAPLPPAQASTNSTAPAPASPAPAPSTPSADKPPAAKDEAYWRDRMRPLRERLDSARALADDTKRRAETLMRAADRCFMLGIVCADYSESLRLTEEHKVLAAAVAHAERDVAALEEEARRAGVPPGWVRE
jgi:type IV secretory pathway VirB10-like protein